MCQSMERNRTLRFTEIHVFPSMIKEGTYRETEMFTEKGVASKPGVIK